jgi:hypothetical protein
LKFFRQNNYTEKAKILYFFNPIYFLNLVGLWQNHVIYWPLTGLMWRNRTPFGKRILSKYGSVCYYYRSFFHGTLHMWARIDNKIFNPVNFVFSFLSMQYIRLTTYCHIFVKQLMTDFCLFQSHLLSQSGNNTVLL